MAHVLRVLFLGDIVGKPGRTIFQKHHERLKKEYSLDGCVVNGENSAHGRGITSRIVRFFKHNGVNVITSGNHVWHHREIYAYLDSNTDLLRPANYPTGVPGTGVTTFRCAGHTIGVINLQGRVFMRDNLDCPFKVADSIITYLQDKTDAIFIDFHAEATSEKIALAYYLDGRVSGVVGTHTHVQTADERVLPNGTAFISDLGMSGSLNSMLGMKKEPIIQNFLTQMPMKFSVAHTSPVIINGAWIEVDTSTGKAITIQRISLIDDTIDVSDED